MSVNIESAKNLTIINSKPAERKVLVTSETARRWLKANSKNRPISESTVERYRTDIENGRWVYAADPIRFSVEGTLLDGQHRLTALSQIPDAQFVALVVTGLPNESQMFMDQGRKRTPGQQLSLLGIKNYNHVASAAKMHIVWKSGLLFKDNTKTNVITSPLIQEWVASNDDLVKLMIENHTQILQNDAPPSVAGAAFCGFVEVNPTQAEVFFQALASGVGLAEGNSILTLDRRLRRVRREGLKMSNRDYLAFFIQAWNAWRGDKKMTKFQRPQGGSWNETNFPEPK